MEAEALPDVLQDTEVSTPERGPSKRSDGALDAMQKDKETGFDAFSLVTEAQAYSIYGHLLEDKELRRARAAGRIGYLRRKRTIHYRSDELEHFVRTLIERSYVRPCQTFSRLNNTMPSMAQEPQPRTLSPPPGAVELSEERLRQAAERLRRVPYGTR